MSDLSLFATHGGSCHIDGGTRIMASVDVDRPSWTRIVAQQSKNACYTCKYVYLPSTLNYLCRLELSPVGGVA